VTGLFESCTRVHNLAPDLNRVERYIEARAPWVGDPRWVAWYERPFTEPFESQPSPECPRYPG